MGVIQGGGTWSTTGEKSLDSVTADSLSGSGGPELNMFSYSIEEIHSIISNANIENITDNTSYDIKGQIFYSPSRAQFSTVQYQELGYGASGKIINPEKEPEDGILEVTDADTGELVGNVTVKGVNYVNSVPPMSRILSGSNEDLGQVNPQIELLPQVEGVGIKRLLSGFGITNLSARYGKATGTVTDADGNPVSGVSVGGPGASTVSGTDGSYSILAPGGTSISLSAMDGAVTKSVTVEAFGSSTVDWQYAGVVLEVNVPGGYPAVGMLVGLSYTGTRQRTDDTGKARFVQVPPNQSGGELQSDALGTFSVDVAGEGSIVEKSTTAGVGFRGQVLDAQTGLPIQNVDVSVGDESIASAETNLEGVFTLGTAETGEVELRVSGRDRRYGTGLATFVVSDGELKETSLELERKENIGTVV